MPSSRPASGSRVPAPWRAEIARVLISEARIKRRIRDLALEITRDHSENELVIAALLNGTVLFLADLIRCLNLPLRLDFVGISSYGNNTRPGELIITKELRLDVEGRDLLILDDILDTGRTLQCVHQRLRKLNPARIRTCVLLEKTARREVAFQADYVGFQVPDLFVVGYGLDYAERYRNLPFVGVLHSDQQPTPTGPPQPGLAVVRKVKSP
ncbi:MAG: hypoxanthine phosphoribosyltransferase [Verrucomicrobia bacterium]|nr:hypoxanthine phosphoribosyltransferase [Verrucomicrobiota bacterium]